jgi:hypothetical protein
MIQGASIMNKKIVFLIVISIMIGVIAYTVITITRSQQMNNDIISYLDKNFHRSNDEIIYKLNNEPYYVYSGYQSNTETPVLYIYHFEDSDLRICSTSLVTHDDYYQNSNYAFDKGSCKDRLFFGSLGISYIVVKYEKNEPINYIINSDQVQVVEINDFLTEDIVIFYYYGTIDSSESIILEGEQIEFN